MLYCPNCGCVTLGKDCEFCGPPELYKKNPTFCIDCGGRKEKRDLAPKEGDDYEWEEEPVELDDSRVKITKLMVCHSNAGYYIGRYSKVIRGDLLGLIEPYSRESSHYYPSRDEAQKALDTEFEVRQCMENKHAYDVGTLPKLNTRKED